MQHTERTTEIKEMESEPKEVQNPEAIVNKITGLVKEYQQASSDMRSEAQDIFSAYMGKIDEVQSTPYDVKESLPTMRTEIAYIKPFIFSGQPEIEVEGIGDEDKAIAKILEKIVNYRIQQSIPQAYEKIESWVHQAVTFGTSVMRVVWKFQTKEETDEDGVVSQVPVMDEPDLDIPNILDVYYNPIIAEIKDQPCLIFRSTQSVETVKNNPAYTYQDSEGNLNREKITESSVNSDPKNSSGQIATDVPNVQGNAKGMVEVFEYVDDERIQTIANGLLLRDTEHEYNCKTSVKFVFEPNTIPNRFAGFGVGSNTLGLNKMHFKMWSQTLQNVKMGNNPMFIYAKGAKVDPKQFPSKPGGGIGVETNGGSLSNFIQPLVFPDIKDGAVQILTKLEDATKRASGANDLIQGSASNDTATQDEIAQANISNRFELIQRRFKQALAELADIIIKMELKNLQSPEASILRIFPQKYRQSIYELLINEAKNVKYNVKVKGETTVARNKALESKRLVDLFNLSQNFLTDKEKRAFLRRIAEKNGEDNIDEIIGEVNEDLEMQKQAQSAQIGMAQGQMPQQNMLGSETTGQLMQGV